MLNQNGDGREGNRLQSKSGPKRSCNRSGTVPECKRPKKTGSYQSSPVFSLFGNLPEPVRVRLPSWDAKKPDRTGLSNTRHDSYVAASCNTASAIFLPLSIHHGTAPCMVYSDQGFQRHPSELCPTEEAPCLQSKELNSSPCRTLAILPGPLSSLFFSCSSFLDHPNSLPTWSRDLILQQLLSGVLSM